MAFKTTAEYEEIANNLTFNTRALIGGQLVAAQSDKLDEVYRLSQGIRAGVILVNHFSEGDMTTPFGGFKQSGFMGRDKSIWANKQYTELKSVFIRTL